PHVLEILSNHYLFFSQYSQLHYGAMFIWHILIDGAIRGLVISPKYLLQICLVLLPYVKFTILSTAIFDTIHIELRGLQLTSCQHRPAAGYEVDTPTFCVNLDKEHSRFTQCLEENRPQKDSKYSTSTNAQTPNMILISVNILFNISHIILDNSNVPFFASAPSLMWEYIAFICKAYLPFAAHQDIYIYIYR
ncbi:hypothetical protein ACJX0J_018867, partial [Zea mays]